VAAGWEGRGKKRTRAFGRGEVVDVVDTDINAVAGYVLLYT
jgi:hypothetical protein